MRDEADGFWIDVQRVHFFYEIRYEISFSIQDENVSERTFRVNE